MELVSIIVPVYNAQQYFDRCVDSLKAQTYSNIEIILVDDGSPDNCGQLCDMAAAEDDRIKVIHKENGGQGLARNAGLEAATGDFVTFVDSDDWMSGDFIARLCQAMTENSADIVLASHSVASSTESISAQRLRIGQGVYDAQALREQLLPSVIGPDVSFLQDVQIESAVWGKLYRRSIIEEQGIVFPSERVVVGEDMFFNALFLNCSRRAVVIDDTGYRYFENSDSTTRKYNPQRYQRTMQFYTQGCSLIGECGLGGDISYRLDRTFLLKVRTALRLVAESDMSYKEKKSEIARYLKNDRVQEVLAGYPIDTYVPAIRLFARLMKAKSTVGVYFLIRFRDMAKRRGFFGKMAKTLGIGR